MACQFVNTFLEMASSFENPEVELTWQGGLGLVSSEVDGLFLLIN